MPLPSKLTLVKLATDKKASAIAMTPAEPTSLSEGMCNAVLPWLQTSSTTGTRPPPMSRRWSNVQCVRASAIAVAPASPTSLPAGQERLTVTTAVLPSVGKWLPSHTRLTTNEYTVQQCAALEGICERSGTFVAHVVAWPHSTHRNR